MGIKNAKSPHKRAFLNLAPPTGLEAESLHSDLSRFQNSSGLSILLVFLQGEHSLQVPL